MFLRECGAVAIRFALCLALECFFPGTGVVVFCLQFAAGEIIGQLITGYKLKTMAIKLMRNVRRARSLANNHLSLLVSKAVSTTEAVNRMVTGVNRISLRNA